MKKQEIEALGQAMLNERGLYAWVARAVYEQDDMGDEDDIAGSYGRAFHEEKLIWVNMRYADDPTLVRKILLTRLPTLCSANGRAISTTRNFGSGCGRSVAVRSTPLLFGPNSQGSVRLLLFACSRASSDSASLPLR